MPRTVDKPLARLTIYGAAKMTSLQRLRLSEWLMQQSYNIENSGAIMAPRFVAKYYKGKTLRVKTPSDHS